MQSKTLLTGVGAIALAAISSFGTVWYLDYQSKVPTDSSNKQTAHSNDADILNKEDTPYATMLAFQSSQGFMGNKKAEEYATENGWYAFTKSEYYETFLKNLTKALSDNAKLVKESGASMNRDIVGAFTWNVSEPIQGTYDWTIPDMTMFAAGEAEVYELGVIQPFASWATTNELNPENCQGIDFIYHDFKGGLPKGTSLENYKIWLQTIVERYDGDGIDDMDGLKTKVSAWEIGNEIEGMCHGSTLTAEEYADFLAISAETIKKADPDAIVMNGGALEIVGGNGQEIPETITFWKAFFAADGADALDVFNLHYNTERSGSLSSTDNWKNLISFYRDLLDDAGREDVKIWATEFGTYSGTPSSPNNGGATIQVPTGMENAGSKTQSESFQTSWFEKYIALGEEYNVEKYFIDLIGPDNSTIGGSAIFSAQSREARPFLKALQAME